MKTLNIKIPEGYEIDKEKSTFEQIVFKKVEKKLSTQWNPNLRCSHYYISAIGDIIETDPDERIAGLAFETKKQAKSFLALSKLIWLRDEYNNGWQPSWNNFNENKFVITRKSHNIVTAVNVCNQKILAFQTQELRDQFFINFRNLIEETKDLI